MEQQKFWLTYEPLLKFVEGGGSIPDDESRIDYDVDNNMVLDKLHPLLRAFIRDFTSKFPGVEDVYFYFGGASQLAVVEVDGPFCVDEYDGFESITTSDAFISLP